MFGQALFNHMHDVPTVEEIKQFQRTDEFKYGQGPAKSSPAFDLMWEMIEPNLTARTTIKKALSHRFFHEVSHKRVFVFWDLFRSSCGPAPL